MAKSKSETASETTATEAKTEKVKKAGKKRPVDMAVVDKMYAEAGWAEAVELLNKAAEVLFKVECPKSRGIERTAKNITKVAKRVAKVGRSTCKSVVYKATHGADPEAKAKKVAEKAEKLAARIERDKKLLAELNKDTK